MVQKPPSFIHRQHLPYVLFSVGNSLISSLLLNAYVIFNLCVSISRFPLEIFCPRKFSSLSYSPCSSYIIVEIVLHYSRNCINHYHLLTFNNLIIFGIIFDTYCSQLNQFQMRQQRPQFISLILVLSIQGLEGKLLIFTFRLSLP